MIPAFLAAPPAAPLIQDQHQIKALYRHWRVQIMVSMFIGYAVFYFVRKNLSAATPALINDLSLSKVSIGSLWSLLYLTYGISKLINGVLGDKSNPRVLMPLGLLVSAFANIGFAMSSSLLGLGFFWAINGWFQGLGWPPCARLLTHWYSPKERGTKWAIWNTAHQVGGGVILLVGGFLAANWGWRSAFYLPAAVAIVTSFYLYWSLRDTPESLGLPPVEIFRQEEVHVENESGSLRHVLIRRVLQNRKIWFLSLANFFVYLVRYGAMDWAPTFLVEVKGSSIANAALKAAGFEFLGIAGAFLAGWASDRYFAGRRSWLNSLYMLILTFALVSFWWIPAGYPVLDALALSSVGFLVYGPQMLVGVCAADLAGKRAAGTSTGVTGLFGYLGSIFSGIGTGYIVDHYGWGGGFIFFVSSAILGAFFFLFTREEPIPKRKLHVA